MLKIRGTEIRQEIFSLTRRAMGTYARALPTSAEADATSALPSELTSASGVAGHYFNSRKLSIFGGSNEIQKNYSY